MKEKSTHFKSAPLPFMGQKRNFINQFIPALSYYPSDAIYVDLFGGSGLLSQTVKTLYPDARVIWNDFDNYKERLENVNKTNALLSDIRDIVKDCIKDKKIEEPFKSEVLNRLRLENNKGFVDWITISSSILFSGKYMLSLEEFEKATLYHTVKMSDYSINNYLEDVERVSIDYKALFEEYKNNINVVFLVDPPYLSTDTSAYKGYWKLHDYLDVLKVLDGTKFFYFTSNKSSIVELCDWIEHSTVGNPFKGATTQTVTNSVNYNSTYTDIMLFK